MRATFPESSRPWCTPPGFFQFCWGEHAYLCRATGVLQSARTLGSSLPANKLCLDGMQPGQMSASVVCQHMSRARVCSAWSCLALLARVGLQLQIYSRPVWQQCHQARCLCYTL